MSLPTAQPLRHVSPSRFKDLTECQLRVAFKQQAPKPGVKSDSQIVGDALHAAMKESVEAGEFERPDALSRVETRFLARVDCAAPGREVPGVRVAAARLKKIAGGIIGLIAEAGTGAVLLCEESLEARDGKLHGVVDLIIDAESLHLIVDYKTGPGTDEEGEINEYYATQLRLYALLEHERSGRWPERGMLFRRGGPPVSLELNADECMAIADRLVEEFDVYNALDGTVPPAHASEESCLFCSFASRCPDFWAAVSPRWSRGAVRGQVVWAEASGGGTLTIQLEEASGSYGGSVVILGLTGAQLEGQLPAPGSQLAVCGVWEDRDGRLHPDKLARVTASQIAS